MFVLEVGSNLFLFYSSPHGCLVPIQEIEGLRTWTVLFFGLTLIDFFFQNMREPTNCLGLQEMFCNLFSSHQKE